MNTRLKKIVIPAVPALLIAAAWLAAGPLDPPVGPVAPAYKTLTEVEPRIAINATNTPGDANSVFKITQPGSYYLTGNITGVAARHGIEVAASNVTIDLRGHALTGVAASLDGISNDGNLVNNIRIENGNISGWSGDGIQFISGSNYHARHINAMTNSGWGIILDENGLVESCAASGNSAGGIGISGLNAVVQGCTVSSNPGTGIRLVDSGTVNGCSAFGNSIGIQTGIGVVVVHCSARDNTDDGIRVGSACVVRDCTAYSNGGDGIDSTGTSTTISNCTASFNVGSGIEVPGDCSIVGNTCDANGQGAGEAAGIQVTGTDCRVDSNTMMRNDTGLEVQLTGNFIVRNTAAGNTTNYEIIANNKVGTIVSAPDSLAISGSTGGAGVGSTNPWSNFSY
jgi:parallel beta-helix repeat protein